MEVRVLHKGAERWLVREAFGDEEPRYWFDPSTPYRPVGLAAHRTYIDSGDVIDVAEKDLQEVER